MACVVNLIKVSLEHLRRLATDDDQSQTFCYCSHIGEVGTRLSRRCGIVWVLSDDRGTLKIGFEGFRLMGKHPAGSGDRCVFNLIKVGKGFAIFPIWLTAFYIVRLMVLTDSSGSRNVLTL